MAPEGSAADLAAAIPAAAVPDAVALAAVASAADVPEAAAPDEDKKYGHVANQIAACPFAYVWIG